jgi:hypothetical protein
MAETLVQFDALVSDRKGQLYEAKACGRERDDGLWEGWLEFANRETGEVLRSSRETTQPNLTDLKYWATGLTPVYLEGALDRILVAPPRKPAEPVSPPAFEGPAEHFEPARKTITRDAILNPFSVYEKSPHILAQELTALRGYHLRQIIREYNLVDDDGVRLESMTEPELGSLIMQRVKELHP